MSTLARRTLITVLTLALGLECMTMATRSDDLGDLFGPQRASRADASQVMTYRQGTILTFDPVTLRNTVRVGGAVIPDIQVLGVGDAAALGPGSVVGIIGVGSDSKTWAIIGRLVTPGTQGATDAITLLGQRAHTATVAASQSTTSATFVDLATVGPAVAGVLVPASGKIEVTIFANLGGPANSVSPRVVNQDNVLIEGPSTFRSLAIAGAGMIGSAVLLYTGLTPGDRLTITLKYRSNGVDTADFSDRTLIVKQL